MDMLLKEWDWDVAKEVWQEEAMEKGREEGMEKGMEKGRNQILELMEQGYTTEQIKAKLTEVFQDRRIAGGPEPDHHGGGA
jgi:flagellar biosynthesis/type III secretory pathway protein FliH